MENTAMKEAREPIAEIDKVTLPFVGDIYTRVKSENQVFRRDTGQMLKEQCVSTRWTRA